VDEQEQVLLRTADGHVTAWLPAEESDFDVDGRYAASFSESVSVCVRACVKRVVRAQKRVVRALVSREVYTQAHKYIRVSATYVCLLHSHTWAYDMLSSFVRIPLTSSRIRIPLHRPAALWRITYDDAALGFEDLEEHEVIEGAGAL